MASCKTVGPYTVYDAELSCELRLQHLAETTHHFSCRYPQYTSRSGMMRPVENIVLLLTASSVSHQFIDSLKGERTRLSKTLVPSQSLTIVL